MYIILILTSIGIQNSADVSVKTIVAELPQEVYVIKALNSDKMISVENNGALVIFGGLTSDYLFDTLY